MCLFLIYNPVLFALERECEKTKLTGFARSSFLFLFCRTLGDNYPVAMVKAGTAMAWGVLAVVVLGKVTFKSN